jgi:hypothetical protein
MVTKTDKPTGNLMIIQFLPLPRYQQDFDP